MRQQQPQRPRKSIICRAISFRNVLTMTAIVGLSFNTFKQSSFALFEQKETTHQWFELEPRTEDVVVDQDPVHSSRAAAAAAVNATSGLQQQQNVHEVLEFTSICDLPAISLSGRTNSAIGLWHSHHATLLEASRALEDRQFQTRPQWEQLLHYLTVPHNRLRRGSANLSHDVVTIRSIIAKLDARLRYSIAQATVADTNNTTSSTVEPPPPIRIAVLGGSVTMGVNCYGKFRSEKGKGCAWPNRLERFLNNLGRTLVSDHLAAQGLLRSSSTTSEILPLVEVKRLAVGGTNTATGTTIWQLDMLADFGMMVPDILVNAYSTNDMHVNTISTKAENVTIRDMVFDMAQEFCRTVLQGGTRADASGTTTACRRPRPLLLWINDYLGNEQRDILTLSHLHQAISVLSNYYGFGYINYANAVRDTVYWNTRETQFSPGGWYRQPNAPMRREIHPQTPMHMTMQFLVSYHLLETVLDYCASSHAAAAATTDETRTAEDMMTPFLQQLPKSLPPKITPDLRLDSISALWNASETAENEQLPVGTTETEALHCNKEMRKCPFTWIYGIPELAVDVMLAKPTERVQNMLPVEWELTNGGKGQKYGWVPMMATTTTTKTPQQPQITFEFEPAQYASFTVFYMRSYGDKWADATATVTVQTPLDNGWQTVGAATLSGIHEKETSETYTETIPLRHATNATSSPLRVRFQLVGGSTFKVSGMAACR